jgi:pteridine reductase
MGVYLLSKSALESLTRLLARRLAPEIRVNAVAPGLILPGEGTSAEEWQRLIARLPLQQQGDPQSVVDAVLFLLDNEHITGQTIVVDGGYQLL